MKDIHYCEQIKIWSYLGYIYTATTDNKYKFVMLLITCHLADTTVCLNVNQIN